MAKLRAKKRKSLPRSAFAYPSVRKYPIHDAAHRRAALSMAAQSGTYGSYAHVKRKIDAKLGRKRSTTRSTKRRRTSKRRKR